MTGYALDKDVITFDTLELNSILNIKFWRRFLEIKFRTERFRFLERFTAKSFCIGPLD